MTAQLDVEALVGLLERAVQEEDDIRYYSGTSSKHRPAYEAFAKASMRALPAILAHIAGESARVAEPVAGAWIAPTSIDDMPAKPGVASYEYVECLILHKGDLLLRPWNCEHKVFDDEAQDDFFCDWDAISAYRVIGHERELAKTSAAIIRGEKLK